MAVIRDESRLVHGDFRADNVVFETGTSRVRAVLDWELSTLGHPLADFTYHLMMYHLPPSIIGGFAGADLKTLGIPSEADYIRAYCPRTRRAGIDYPELLHGVQHVPFRGNSARYSWADRSRHRELRSRANHGRQRRT